MDKVDNLKFKYESLASWIEKADTKAEILIGVQLFILGYVIEKQVTSFGLSLLGSLLLFVFLICSIFALYNLYLIIRPRLTSKISNSKIYFRDLAKQAENDREKIKQVLINEDETSFIDDMAEQILSLSKVCNDKHESLLTAEKFMVASFLLGIAIYIINQFFC